MCTPTDIIPWFEGACTPLRVGGMYGVVYMKAINLHVYL